MTHNSLVHLLVLTSILLYIYNEECHEFLSPFQMMTCTLSQASVLGSQLSASLEMQEDKARSEATALAQVKVRRGMVTLNMHHE